MTRLGAKEAGEAIKAGQLHGPVVVEGRLDLSGYEGETLPAGLNCYELDARESKLTSLPPDIQIESRLVLDNCRSLRSLPEGLTTGSISLRGCLGLLSLPENLDTWFLDMTGCSQFEYWPKRGSIRNGSLILRNCINVSSLPEWLGRLSQLNLAGCVRLSEIPESVIVSGWVDVGGTGITRLPSTMPDVSLRWRGVRINERIAFKPEELTAREVLAEGNTELRRVMMERMGYLKFAQEAGAKVLDEDKDGGGKRQLLSIHLKEDEPLVGLACFCPSTGRQYFLRVPPNMKSCHQAAAWMAGYDDASLYRPQIET